MITASMKKQVEDKLRACIATAERRYNTTFRFPNIRYDLRGTTAGTATYSTWTININPVLLAENFDDMLADTVPHEMAHLITDQVYPEAHQRTGNMTRTRNGVWRRPKRSPHGEEWKSVMRVLGCDPRRTHSYDVSNARTRERTTYAYKCNCCGAELQMGPKRHAKEQRTPGSYTHSSCGRSAGKLTLVTSKAPAATVHVKPTAPATPKAPATGTGSKLERCYAMYKSHPTLPRASLIQHFVQLGCTPAGAATYYATCRKMYTSGK